MARNIRFHLDGHMDKALAVGLRRLGIDVTTTAEENMLGVDDAAQLEFAVLHERVFVTSDTDFLRLHSLDEPHHGVVFVRDELRQQVGVVIRYLELLWSVEEKDAMRNRVEYAF